MREANADDATIRLILEAAERHGDPESDVRGLPYAAPGFDAALKRADGDVTRLLGRRHVLFAEDMLDEAGVMREAVTDPRSGAWDVEARLFGVIVRAPPSVVTDMSSPRGLRDFATMLSANGLSHPGARFGFAPMPLSLGVMGDLCPGKVRRLTHCLASRVTPGFPPPPVHDVRVALGVTGEAPPPTGADADAPVTRAIVGVRVNRVRTGRPLPWDWLCHFGGDAGSISEGTHLPWAEAVAARFSPAGGFVGLPSSWMGTCTEMAVAEVLEAFHREAGLLGASGETYKGALHHVRHGDELLVAFTSEDGTSLGPVRAPRHLMTSGMMLLVTDMDNVAEVEHVDGSSFSHAVMGGTVAGEEDEEDGRGSAPTSTLH